MELELSHGRDDPDKDMGDWGFDGPALRGVKSLLQEYGAQTTVRFLTEDAAMEAQAITGWPLRDEISLEVLRHGDLVETHEPDCGMPRYYGDLLLCQRDVHADLVQVAECVRRAESALHEAARALQRKLCRTSLKK